MDTIIYFSEVVFTVDLIYDKTVNMYKAIEKISRGYEGDLKRRVLFFYFKNLLKNRIRKVSSSGNFKMGKITVKYPMLASFFGMFFEIFVEQNYYLKPSEKPMTIIDAGSNIGMSLVYFKTVCPNAKIIAFEPGAETFKFLEDNVQENSLTDIVLHNVALSDVDGELDFYTDADMATSQGASFTKHLESKNRSLAKTTVQARRLSGYLPKEGMIDILKLDIEGAEGQVIKELFDSANLSRFNTVFMEYHYDGVNTTYPLGTILSHLEQSGFEHVIASPFELPYRPEDRKKLYSYKIVATHSRMREVVGA